MKFTFLEWECDSCLGSELSHKRGICQYGDRDINTPPHPEPIHHPWFQPLRIQRVGLTRKKYE
jgi:hypothetical protein